MKHPKLKHDDLDQKLSLLAENLDTYDDGLRALVDQVDGRGMSLEARDPESWRDPFTSTSDHQVASIEEQFRREVDRIQLQDREAEAKLARRIEFARLRYNVALERAGIDPEDISGHLPAAPSGGNKCTDEKSGYPDEVLCRSKELHALRTELVERNLYLVLINVERYTHSRVSRMDLIQEGSSVLFRAVDGFDWRRGLYFRTYAVHWLNQAFRSYLYNFGNTVRVPVYLQKAMKHVRDAKERLGDAPHSVKAIAMEADLAEKVVISALGATRSTHSIDASLFGANGDGLSLSETLSSGEEGLYQASMEDVSAEEGVQMALESLSDRERHVIGLRFGLTGAREHTLAEIATLLGVSLERIRQIQVRAISKMKTPRLRKAVDPHLI